MVEVNLIVKGNATKEMLYEDKTLLSQLRDKGVYINAFCGGDRQCNKCKIVVDGKVCLACQTYPKLNQTIETLDYENSNIRVYDANCDNKVGILAIDLGTTTIDFTVVNSNNELIFENKITNPQVVFGADVITRIRNSSDNNLSKMQKCVIDAINRQLEIFRLSVNDFKIEKIVVSGNTTMLHILYNENIDSLGVAPYAPVFLKNRSVLARQLGIDADCRVFTASGISTFVGSDISLGILSVGFAKSGKYNVLIDLGTNAEIAVFNEKVCIATAAAAGPCFEGANISCGMNALNGAIYSIDLNGNCKVIGNVRATGICGTGLIEAVDYLLKKGAIDESGYLTCEEAFSLCDDVKLTQQDIREFQLAKSAIYSALLCLLETQNILKDDIENIYLSGGFSDFLDVVKAINVGLLPKEFEEKYKVVGNSSLEGAIMYAFEKQKIDEFSEKGKYIDLSCDKRFSELFINNMMFGEPNEK